MVASHLHLGALALANARRKSSSRTGDDFRRHARQRRAFVHSRFVPRPPSVIRGELREKPRHHRTETPPENRIQASTRPSEDALSKIPGDVNLTPNPFAPIALLRRRHLVSQFQILKTQINRIRHVCRPRVFRTALNRSFQWLGNCLSYLQGFSQSPDHQQHKILEQQWASQPRLVAVRSFPHARRTSSAKSSIQPTRKDEYDVLVKKAELEKQMTSRAKMAKDVFAIS